MSKTVRNFAIFLILLLILYFWFPGVLDTIIGWIMAVFNALVEIIRAIADAIVRVFNKAP